MVTCRQIFQIYGTFCHLGCRYCHPGCIILFFQIFCCGSCYKFISFCLIGKVPQADLHIVGDHLNPIKIKDRSVQCLISIYLYLDLQGGIHLCVIFPVFQIQMTGYRKLLSFFILGIIITSVHIPDDPCREGCFLTIHLCSIDYGLCRQVKSLCCFGHTVGNSCHRLHRSSQSLISTGTYPERAVKIFCCLLSCCSSGSNCNLEGMRSHCQSLLRQKPQFCALSGSQTGITGKGYTASLAAVEGQIQILVRHIFQSIGFGLRQSFVAPLQLGKVCCVIFCDLQIFLLYRIPLSVHGNMYRISAAVICQEIKGFIKDSVFLPRQYIELEAFPWLQQSLHILFFKIL